jgi:hypothetical protein
LDELMVELSREQGSEEMQDEGEDFTGEDIGGRDGYEREDNEVGNEQYGLADTGRSATFTQRANDDRERGDECDETIRTTVTASGSIFVPSISEG